MTTAQGTEETHFRDNPGLKFCVWPKAFVHAAQTIVDRVFDEEFLNQEYRDDIQSNDVQVTQIVKPTLSVAIHPRELNWMLENASVTASGARRDRFGEGSFEKRVFGSFDVSIAVVSSGPFYNQTYSVDMHTSNLHFSVSSYDNAGNFIKVSDIINGSSCGKRPSGNVFVNAGGSLICNSFNEPSTKRCRTDTSFTSSGGNGKSVISMGSGGMTILSGSGNKICMGSGGMIINSGSGNEISMGNGGMTIKSGGGNVISMGNGGMTINSGGGKGRGGMSMTSSVINGMSITSNGGNGISFTSDGRNGMSVISNGRIEVSVSSSGRGADHDLGRTLACALEIAILECLNSRLPDYSFPLGCTSDWMFNYSALSKPKFHNGYMESQHLAAIHYNGDTITLPTQAAPFPEPQNSSRMLTIFISNCLFNTVGCCFQQYGILNYNLTQADLTPQAPDDASVRTRCLSDCFPEFSLKYPGASVEVILASSKAPTATFSGQNLKIILFGSALFRAHLADGSFADFLKTEISLEITVMLKLRLGKLMGAVTSILPRSVAVIESALESLNREVLKEAFDLIATQFLRRKIEELTQEGIPLPCPLLSGVEELENVEMWAATDDFLRIDTDLKFHA